MQSVLYFWLLFCSSLLVTAQSANLPAITAETSKYDNNRIVKSTLYYQLKEPVEIEMKKIQFIFKKIDANRRIVSFGPEDVLFLEEQFMKQANIMYCKSDVVDKKIEIAFLKTHAATTPFNHKEFINSLYEQGYVTTSMRSSTELVFFEPDNYRKNLKICDPNNQQTIDDILANGLEISEKPCEAGSISNELQKKYKTIENWQPLIDTQNVPSAIEKRQLLPELLLEDDVNNVPN